MDITDCKNTKITTKIAVIFICLVVTVSMLTAAPARAAENESAADQTQTTQEAADPDDGEEEVVAPDEVDNVKATTVARGKTIVKWTPVKDADGYYIFRSSKKSGAYKKIARVKGENRRKYINRYKQLRKNRTYYYKVYAYKRVNGENILSESADRDAAKNSLSYKKKYTMKATAYSGGGLCANGKRCKVGRVAVDPDVIPLGTWLYVKGYGFCQACDTGGAIQGRRIDLYYNTESKCNAYGVRYTKVYVLRK